MYSFAAESIEWYDPARVDFYVKFEYHYPDQFRKEEDQ